MSAPLNNQLAYLVYQVGAASDEGIDAAIMLASKCAHVPKVNENRRAVWLDIGRLLRREQRRRVRRINS